MARQPPGIGTAYRVFRGDQFLLRTFGQVAVNVSASVYVLYDDGSDGNFSMQVTTSVGAIVQDTSATVPKPGWAVSCSADAGTQTLKRGQLWARIRAGSSSVFGFNRQFLAADYIYSEHSLVLGHFGDGVGGAGLMTPRSVADDIAPADIQTSLAVNNTIRRIDGFAWYYHASGTVASRALRATVRDMGSGLPTGMTSGLNTSIKNYPSAGTLTLTSNEEGVIYVNAASGKSFAASVDAGTPTIEDITTQPDPFPYWASETDAGEIFFNVANEEADDRHSIWLFEESWIQS